jgi:cytidine deaminase
MAVAVKASAAAMAKAAKSEKWSRLFLEAKRVRKNAHAPYSKYQVGAAIEMSSGEIFAGCNVENMSYGATICAERNAIFAAVAKGETKIQRILVITDDRPAARPCAMCLQVISEFVIGSNGTKSEVKILNLGGPKQHADAGERFASETEIAVADLNGIVETFFFSELLPHRFDGSSLFVADRVKPPDAKAKAKGEPRSKERVEPRLKVKAKSKASTLEKSPKRNDGKSRKKTS